ncbi:tetratricopeptide repeat protein [Aquimarina celericrescens]|uniref:Tol-pal system YbgF family protein n=1 Tax=Aquimarina celericrescens TaxID=1964542 RepID=A0ABW5AY66_9FLAO|nr:hypothetical protein [Aquimarina celericrescens]
MSDFLTEIDKYLDDTMSSEEKKAFEDRLRTDSFLAEELKLQKDIRLIYEDKEWIQGNKSVLRSKHAKELNSFLKSEEAFSLQKTIKEVILEQQDTNSRNRTFYFVGIAAVLVVLIVISFFINSENKYDQLYSQYIQLDSLPSLVTRGEQDTQLIIKGQMYFEDQKYEEAIRAFSEYRNSITSKSIEPSVYVYTGISYIELRDFENALKQFELLSKSNTLHSKKANWYRAMVYLKQNNDKELRNTLQLILSNVENYNFQEALELVNKIDK